MLEPDYGKLALISGKSMSEFMEIVKDNKNINLEEISVFENLKVIAYKPEVAKYLGSIEAAIYHQQLTHWQKYATRPDGFFYKSAKEIEDETYISEKIQRRCREQLSKLEWIEVVKKMANGHPTYHFRVIIRSFTVMSPTGQMPVPIGQTASSITKNTTLDKNNYAAKAAGPPKEKLEAIIINLGGILNQRARPTDGRIAKLKARLKNFTEEDIYKAARGLTESPFHMGENPQKTKYATVDFLLRNDEKIDEWSQKATKEEMFLVEENDDEMKRFRGEIK